MVPGMFRRLTWAAAVLVALTFAGCSLDTRGDASRAIARFLDAARTGDHATFEAAIDRPALRSDLRDQLADLGRAKGLVVEGGASDFALDRRITPSAIKLVDEAAGREVSHPPTAAQVARQLIVRDRSHACLASPSKGPCVLSFVRRKGVWRLTGMPAHETQIVLGAPVAKQP